MAEYGHEEDAASHSPATEENAGTSLLDLLIIIARYKKVLFGVPLAVGIVTALLTLLMANVYTATARVLPPQQSSSTASLLAGQLGVLAGLSGAGLGLKSPNDLYVGMLKSRTVADRLIERFDLKKVFGTRDDTLTRLALANQSTIAPGTDGIITIAVDYIDPKLAAALANGYVDELRALTQTLAVTESSKRRVFFEQQLRTAKESLASAEMAFKATQEKTGLVRIEDQGRAIIEGVARMRAAVAAKEVQISAIRMFATSENPDLLRLQQELAALRAQLASAERDQRSEDGGVFLPTGKIAESGLEYVRRLRDVKYHEGVYELLAKQYEIAKIDEAKDSALIQVLDEAVPPDRKSKPKRASITIAMTMVAAFGALLWVFVSELVKRIERDPEQARKLALLRGYLSFRLPSLRRHARARDSHTPQ